MIVSRLVDDPDTDLPECLQRTHRDGHKFLWVAHVVWFRDAVPPGYKDGPSVLIAAAS